MTTVYELTTLEIRIRSNDAVYAALQKSLPEAGGRLLGAFVPDIGDLNRLFLLREFADGNALIKARVAMHQSADPLGCHEWLLSMRSRSFALFPFLPAVQVSAHGPCYEIRTYTLRQNKLAATWASWQAALPARLAMSPLIGAFSALDGDVPGIMHIWAYPNVETRGRIRAEATKLGIWPPPGGGDSFATMQTTICLAAPFSPLR